MSRARCRPANGPTSRGRSAIRRRSCSSASAANSPCSTARAAGAASPILAIASPSRPARAGISTTIFRSEPGLFSLSRFKARERALGALLLQRLQQFLLGDEIGVAPALELVDRDLAGDLLDGGDDAGLARFAAAPAEMREVVLEAALAAAEMGAHRGAHEGPAQPDALGHGGVDIREVADSGLDQAVGFLPDRVLQPVGDEGLDLLLEAQGTLADGGVEGDGPVEHLCGRRLRANHLHQRYQMRRGEGMADDDP